ncbi:MAG: hypothetical protein R3F62_01105 [Planctomycetota bacterium]
MSDAELREVERALAETPDDLELLRQQAALLRRSGFPEQALSALDLAWRLGAEDLEQELGQELAGRRLELEGLSLRYVPAGPFVMGIEGFDADCSPAHLVRLSGYWISQIPVTFRALKDDPRFHPNFRRAIEEDPRGWYARHPFTADRAKALECVDFLQDALEAAGLPDGRLRLPTEAQWERGLRSTLLRSDATSIYGVERGITVEWIRDPYAPTAYAEGPRFDPQGPSEGDGQFCVRGVASLPPDVYPLYRDAANATGSFTVGGRRDQRTVRHEGGIAFRVVLEPR